MCWVVKIVGKIVGFAALTVLLALRIALAAVLACGFRRWRTGIPIEAVQRFRSKAARDSGDPDQVVIGVVNGVRSPDQRQA